MAEKEYIVSLERGVDPASFAAEMTQSKGDETIPNRSVDIVNKRESSQRNTHYALTEAEVEKLKNDPRVKGIEIPPEQRDDISIGLRGRQTSNFTKTTSDVGDYVNWGLRRCISPVNPYGTQSTVSGDYTYNLDGTGVDIVIQDGGIELNHPEWLDANGETRLQPIDWYSESGISGDVQSPYHYRDYDGHGTHVAGIAAGKNYGWAKNARIYAMKVSGLEGPGDAGGIPVVYCFDAIKLWHRQKAPDPITGIRRPTVVNMSWGYGAYFYNVDRGVYRGTSWTSPDNTGIYRDTSKGMIGSLYDQTYGYRFGVRITSIDVDIQEMIDEGIHVVIAAGNYSQKIDVPGGLDYDNYFVNTSQVGYLYNRGSSPYDDEAFIVGNSDSVAYSSSLEQKATSSETGPGVDLYAPGTDIMSACSTNNQFSAAPYFFDGEYRQTNISGTSMAAPQVAGHIACLLQLKPNMSTADMKTKVLNQTSKNIIYSTGLDNDYTNLRSISNGNNKFLLTPYSREYSFSIERNS